MANNYEPDQAGEALAVDVVDTWCITALGAATVDSWWGPGTGYKIWKNVKPWGGYYGPNGNAVTDAIWGVGYSDVDKNSVMSAEWTAGAINMVHMLVEYYTANPDGITAAQLQELKDDRNSMLKNLVNMRNDQVSFRQLYGRTPARISHHGAGRTVGFSLLLETILYTFWMVWKSPAECRIHHLARNASLYL